MKKIILTILLGLSTYISFSQNKYRYEIKIDSITNIHKETVTWLQGMFTTTPIYNDTTKCFILNSDFDISQNLFVRKANDRNYNVLIFNKVSVINNDTNKNKSKQ